MSKKKILFHSNCSKVLSGFGKNTRNVLTYLYRTGKYDIVEFANGVKENSPALETFPWKAIGSFPDDKAIEEQIKTDRNLKNKVGYGHLRIEDVIEQEKPDVYIGAEDLWAFSGLWEKKWWRQIKTILWVTLDSNPILKSAYEAAKSTDHFLTWSNFPQKELQSKGIKNSECIHGPVDSTNFFKLDADIKKELRRRFSIEDKDFIIGFVFRNQLRKSVTNLVDAFIKFKEQNSNAKLLLHTSWEEGWDIPALIKEKKLDNNDILTTYYCKECGNYEVKPFQGESKSKQVAQDCPFCGEKSCQKTINVHNGPSEKQLNEIYNIMDVYCHPFTSGGQEIPIQEAKLCELITLVTDYSCGEDCSSESCGSFPLSWNEYREPNTQFIKASTSPESIVSKLIKVSKLNNSKKEKMGRQGRQFVLNNYSVEKNCERLMELIDQEKDITWDYKIKSLEADFDKPIPENLSDAEYILFIYNELLKLKISKKDEVFPFLIQKLNSGVPRAKILDALINNHKKEQASKPPEEYDIRKYIDFDRSNKRIALVLPQSIGDVFMATSLFKDISETYDGYDIYFITKEQYFPVLEGNPYIHKVIPYDPFCADALMLEGFSNRNDRPDQDTFFNVAIILNVNNQRVLNYTRNGEDKISLELCT